MKKLAFMVVLVVVLEVSCTSANLPSKATPNQSPTAFIDSISPIESKLGEKVSFRGHASDPDGTAVAYKWRSSLDGDLSTTANFANSSLSEGKHTIYFKGQDNDGAWSEEVQKVVTVVPAKTVPAPVVNYFQADPARISSGNPAVLSWYVSGATTVYIDQEIGNVALTGNLRVYPPASVQYTLIATNEGSSVSSQTTVLVVPAKVGLPVINTFAADPGNITAGSAAVLSWYVSNAEFVRIDPGVGAINPVGSALVSPVKATEYTLTAYNSVGIAISTTRVLVTTAPTFGRPDLVIVDISKVEIASGVNITYTVENRGTNDAPPSTTRLYANGIYRASDTLGVVPAGSSASGQISGWLYNPATNVIKVVLDADNNVVESDESNNSNLVAFSVKTVFDFIDNAGSAVWGVEYPYKSLVFGGTPIEREGFVLYQTGKKMEDGSIPARLLETRPYSIYNGWIIGDYDTGIQVKAGDAFYSLVGLVEGAVAGDVEFWVYIRSHGAIEWDTLVSGVGDIYDYRIKAIAMPIPTLYFGKNVDFSLRVNVNGEPLQDWAAWVEAKILR